MGTGSGAKWEKSYDERDNDNVWKKTYQEGGKTVSDCRPEHGEHYTETKYPDGSTYRTDDDGKTVKTSGK